MSAPAANASAAEAPTARFAAGDRVLVRDDWPERRGRVHLRTPHYLRGRPGTVQSVLGAFANPEDLAFARPAPLRVLYHVLFEQKPLFGEGQQGDDMLVEVFEHWLEPATTETTP